MIGREFMDGQDGTLFNSTHFVNDVVPLHLHGMARA
jgi:hypothetical protein